MRNINVLIVEDIDSMRLLLSELLDGSQFSAPGDEGAGKLRVSGLARNVWEARGEVLRNRPDLVLLDEVLPGESSLDFLEELRKDAIPCILLTSMTERDAPVPEGALARIAKPGERARQDDRLNLTNIIGKWFLTLYKS